jgi:LPLT family lysophospholipid transporter-like MFS transporter
MLAAVGAYTFAASQQVSPVVALIALGSLVFIATFLVSLRLPEQTTES